MAIFKPQTNVDIAKKAENRCKLISGCVSASENADQLRKKEADRYGSNYPNKSCRIIN